MAWREWNRGGKASKWCIFEMLPLWVTKAFLSEVKNAPQKCLSDARYAANDF